MDYKIVSENSPEDLEAEVIKLLGNAWHLQGGVSIAYSNGKDIIYIQALTRKGLNRKVLTKE
jgi:hypothetical protein